MKLCVKKVHCSNCQRLVKCREESVDGKVNIVCSRCGNAIWIENGITWRYVARNRKNEISPGQAEGTPKKTARTDRKIA